MQGIKKKKHHPVYLDTSGHEISAVLKKVFATVSERFFQILSELFFASDFKLKTHRLRGRKKPQMRNRLWEMQRLRRRGGGERGEKEEGLAPGFVCQ